MRCWRDENAPLIGNVASSDDKTGLLHPLKQRAQCSHVEMKAFAQLPNRCPFTFPKHQHYQVLGIGKAQWGEQRPIEPLQKVGCRIQRKADLSVKPKEIVVFPLPSSPHRVLTEIATSTLPRVALE